MNGPIREDKKAEYLIRKHQHAIEVIKRKDHECTAMGGDEMKRRHILERAAQIIELKKFLLNLTGRCSPNDPKWPV
jgi:hypothetical protein